MLKPKLIKWTSQSVCKRYWVRFQLNVSGTSFLRHVHCSVTDIFRDPKYPQVHIKRSNAIWLCMISKFCFILTIILLLLIFAQYYIWPRKNYIICSGEDALCEGLETDVKNKFVRKENRAGKNFRLSFF